MSYDQQDQENRENQEQAITYTGRHNEYVQGQLLGKGAYGKVFLVRNYRTNEEYALKRIQVPVTGDGIPQSVLREISTMQQFRDLDHPNVLKLHDVFHNFGHSNRRRNLVVNMVVPKCDWDLYIFLRSLPRDMPENQSKMMARQMFSGIDYLHSMNIVHRDIKPQNILVNKDLSIKLADFGLSRGLTSHSAFTTVVVTLWYRSPELLLQTPYNSAVDIWAAGCILSELYAREALFPGQTEAGQLSLIFHKLGTPTMAQWPRGAAIDRNYYGNLPCQPMEKINPKISQQAAGLVRRCLEYNTLTRCTAAEALTDPYFFEGARAYQK